MIHALVFAQPHFDSHICLAFVLAMRNEMCPLEVILDFIFEIWRIGKYFFSTLFFPQS